MALRKSGQLLPQVFQTDKNKKFLNASVDQLISEPQQERVNGFIGRKFALNYSAGDSYVSELSTDRQNYQLEPAVTYKNSSGTVESVTGYSDFINRLRYYQGDTDNHDKLFEQQYYNWSGFVDYDKLVNYGEYFWLPNGPDPVQVFSSLIDTEKEFAVFRDGTTYVNVAYDAIGYDEGKYDEETAEILSGNPYYRFHNSTSQNINETLYLARGGTYTFNVNQAGIPFWIQTEPGITGASSFQKNIDPRDVKGVTNNGEDNGTITFNVPMADDDKFFLTMTTLMNVDFATDLKYTDLHNIQYETFIANSKDLDGETEFDGKTVVLMNRSGSDDDWTQGDLFDAYPYDSQAPVIDFPYPFDSVGFDTDANGGTIGFDQDQVMQEAGTGQPGSFDPAVYIPLNDRYDVYRIQMEVTSDTTTLSTLDNNLTESSGKTIKLTRITEFPGSQKVRVKNGRKYGSREIWKNGDGYLELIDTTTASQSTLYYCDGQDVNRFGKIELVEVDKNPGINITEDILGKTSYTSPNGVTLTNGLKVQFNTDVAPSSYGDSDYFVEGVGESITLVKAADLVVPETFVKSTSEPYDTQGYDTGSFDQSYNSPTTHDYLTINRGSKDLNAWSRGNRWFHRQVIDDTAKYNKYVKDIDQTARATRPIIEFLSGLELFNMGTTSLEPVNVIDTTQIDALSNVQGSEGYFADKVALETQKTVCFINDADSETKKNIYRVQFIDQDNDASTNQIIQLIKIATAVKGDCLLSKEGVNQQGKQYWFNGTDWKEAQQKTKVQQEPLFNIQDGSHTSFNDATSYPSSNFVGNKLFSYKRNTTPGATEDSTLGFALSYKNFSNIGDILFENNFDKDTFDYTKSTGLTSVIVRSGHSHRFDPVSNTRKLMNGWTRIKNNSKQFQIVSHVVSSDLFTFEIGGKPNIDDSNNLIVYVNSAYQTPTKWTRLDQDGRYYIVFNSGLAVDDIVTIKIFSDTVIPNAFYEVPRNIENNADNADFDELTLGQLRNHLVEISHNIPEFTGQAPGNNNIRDINYSVYPGKILQHSAGGIVPNYLFEDCPTNIVDSIKYTKDEYTRFKNKFLDNVDKLDLDYRDISKCVDDIILHMKGTKTSSYPFYYSDMVPWGSQKATTTITIDDIKEIRFEFSNQFDLTELSQRGVLVYHTPIATKSPNLLVEGVEYIFETETAAINLVTDRQGAAVITLAVGDVVTIVEYTETDGSFIPPTPTKMGLWPKYTPQKYIDNSYVEDQTVVQGHDGSIWVAYGDVRDDVLLEFEKRVYNNIKTQYSRDLFDWSDVLPGYFRSTTKDRLGVNTLASQYFGTWAQKNRVSTQSNDTYNSNDAFTWNYSNSTTIDKQWAIPGFWRGLYNWLYDTDTPHTTPWEMLGLSQKPSWWDDRYGVAPYTAGNAILWEDLRDAKLYSSATDDTYTTVSNRSRPDLLTYIPTDPQGNLRAPNQFALKTAFQQDAGNAWKFGDAHPAETAWRRSSEWSFVAQIIGAVMKPAKYCTVLFDTNLQEYNSQYNQIMQKNKTYRPKLADLNLHGALASNNITVNRVEGFNQFISGWLTHQNINLTDQQTKIKNLQLNLVYKIAGFSDKKMLKVVAENATPTSSNQTIFIPDEDYHVFKHKSLPLEPVTYSGVKIIKRPRGYEIQGYDIGYPFFKIIPSQRSDQRNIHTVGQSTFTQFNDFKREIVPIPYGTTLSSAQQVFDFLVSYERYLTNRGFIFNDPDSGEITSFVDCAKEFAFWVQQNFDPGSVITLSPIFSKCIIERPFTTVDDLSKSTKVRDFNGQPIKKKHYNVSRIDNRIEITVDTNFTQLYSVTVDPIQYEHCLVFNNKTIFNDILFQPELGNRQERLKVIGFKSGSWNGTLHAPGFFINEDKFDLWQANKDYKKGDFISQRKKIYVAKENHGGKATFDFEDWTDADKMKTGLQKNLANKAGSFETFFDTDQLNLEGSTDKLGKGQIGFKSRSFLENLGLDDISQVKFYQGMIDSKGSPDVINKLIQAQLGNVDQSIETYEEWGFRVGEFGSIDSNQVVEFILEENKSPSNNPLVTQLLNNGDTYPTNALGFKKKDLYKVPNQYEKNVLLNRGTNSYTKFDLQACGYPRLDDVDLTIFDINNITSALDDNIGKLGRGTKIWVAKDGSTWSMYRSTELGVEVTGMRTTNNGFTIYTTEQPHNLNKDDIFIVKSPDVFGGVFKVAVANDKPTEITINSELLSDGTFQEFEAISGISVPCLKLEKVRFAQPKDIASFVPKYGFNDNEIIWVDTDENGKWAAYKKSRPWTTSGIKAVDGIVGSGNFGTSVSTSNSGSTGLVGQPNANEGIVVPYVITADGLLEQSTNIEPTDYTGVLDSFGWSVTSGDQYHLIGAPDTNNGKGACFVYYRDSTGSFEALQLLAPSDLSNNDLFGYSVSISDDDKWAFVGAPGGNKVYTYALDELTLADTQVTTVTGNGSTTAFNLVAPLTTNTAYVTDANDKILIPNKDYTISSRTINFTTAPADTLQMIIRKKSRYIQLTTLTGSTSATGDAFGKSMDCNIDGTDIVVGAPTADVLYSSVTYTDAGEAFGFSQVVEKFTADGTTKSVTTTATHGNKIFVTVDGVYQTFTNNDDASPTLNTDGSSTNFYTTSSKTITFKYTPGLGSIIKVFTGNYVEFQRFGQDLVTGQAPTDKENFGQSVAIDTYGSMIVIGSPGEDETNPNTGSAFVFADAGLRYGTVDTSAATVTANHSILINDTEVVFSSSAANPNNIVSDINLKDIITVSSSVSADSFVTISTTATNSNRRVRVRPGNGNSFATTLLVRPFKFIQKISHPQLFDNENFGQHIAFDKHQNKQSAQGTQNFIISSDKASALLKTQFDKDTDANSTTYNEYLTTFDSTSTQFVDKQQSSGAVYAYELMPAYYETLSNPAQYAFVQQMNSASIATFDEFGSAIAFRDDQIFIGSRLDDDKADNGGSVYQFDNKNRTQAWNKWRAEDTKVDIDRINRLVTYNTRSNQIVTFLDYIDPYKGKIAGEAAAELDYITPYDPAVYTIGNVTNQVNSAGAWNNEFRSRTWWDLNSCAILDYEQGDLDFRTAYWGQFFPGSTIDVYEWVESSVLPSQYTGDGTPKYPNDTNYSTAEIYNPEQNETQTIFYFWVKGKTSVNTLDEFRNISTSAVEQLITDPKAQGLAYMAPYNQSTFGFYNIQDTFADKDLVFSMNYDTVANDGIVHSEFDLVSENDASQAIPTRIYNKIVDSLSGADTTGQIVPNPYLSEVERYGVAIRPRQSVFKNAKRAVQVLVEYCNKIFKTVPLVRQNVMTDLLSAEPQPSKISGEYDEKVSNIIERDYLNTATMATGYKVLVNADEKLDNLWTIYTLQADKSYLLTKIQAYNTPSYWNYITWYADGFDTTTVPTFQVDNESGLLTLTDAKTDDIAKVLSNDDGNFSFFQLQSNNTWKEIIIEKGTVELLSNLYESANQTYGTYVGFDADVFDFKNFDKTPQSEIRKILSALKDQVFVEDLAVHFNKLFFRLIEYALHENQSQNDWVFKSSFIKIKHRIRNLDQYPTYKNDNTTFIEDFIKEVKPYHTKIREYVAKYDKVDTLLGDLTDFDVHAFYDTNLEYFRKPSGDFAGDEAQWEIGLNSQWNENRGYYVNSIEIHDAGSGYIINPTLTISKPDVSTGVQATAIATTNTDSIIRVVVTEKGSGYTKTPTITLTGAGTGAVLLPRIQNDTNREFNTTLKFDRITYNSIVKDWTANTSYDHLDLIAYKNTNTGIQEVYKVNVTGGFTSGATFSAEDATGVESLVVYEDKSLASSADRIAAYYTPTENMIGDDLKLLQSGTDYNGIKISGAAFDREPGWDSAAWDNIGFDDFEINADGLTVLSGASALDTVLQSTFSDLELGTRPEDINITGGDFIDTQNSHAPEEVIPGIVFDTLDMEIYTDPSDDFTFDGNGCPIFYTAHAGDGETSEFTYANTSMNSDVDNIFVYLDDVIQRDATINYIDRTIALNTPPLTSQTVHIYSYGNTGENITHEEIFTGDGSTVVFTLGVNFEQTKQVLVLVDGVSTQNSFIKVDNLVQVTLEASAPVNRSHVHIYVSSLAVGRDAFTLIETQEATLPAPSSTLYSTTLSNPPQYAQPLTGNMVAEINGVRLRPANSKYHVADGSSIVFSIPDTSGEDATVTQGDITVTHIDKANKTTNNLSIYQDYTVAQQTTLIADSADRTDILSDTIDYSADTTSSLNTANTVVVTLTTGRATLVNENDIIIVSVTKDAEYTIDGSTFTFNEKTPTFSEGDKLHVTTFANHDPLRIQTKVFEGRGTETSVVVYGYDADIGFDSDTSGFDGSALSGSAVSRYKLDRTVGNLSHAWVTLNGVKLHPGKGYTIDENGFLDLSKVTVGDTDIVVISHFTENLYEPTIGYRYFKTMTGNIEYRRLSFENSTILAEDFGTTDEKIYVEDVTKLPVVNQNSAYPGVIFIGSERITYWQISYEDNYITQLRRGTAGTSHIPTLRKGSIVIDGGLDQKLPDTSTHTKHWYNKGVKFATDAQGLQASTTTNAKFLKDKEARVPSYTVELSQPQYMKDDYVEVDYVETRQF